MNRVTAALLAFFLGGFGLQWFYLKQPEKGFLSIIFFWTGIPAIIALYHTFVFLTSDDFQFNEKYNPPVK
jgi:TM2 domain-containing membrane protein YozV